MKLNIMNKPEKSITQDLLQKKRERTEIDSNEKTVYLCEINGDTELIKEEITFQSISDLSKFLSMLENPYTIINNQVINLNNSGLQEYFYNNIDSDKIYQRDNNSELYEDYKNYNSKFEESKPGMIKIEYPRTLDKVLIGCKFFFNLSHKNYPKYYRGEDKYYKEFIYFLGSNDYNMFHLYIRKNAGTSLYLMRQMERQSEYFFYIDFRKLNEILLLGKE